jgi:hypothetical protein
MTKVITLKTLPEATALEVFDYIVTHLRKQGRKSLISEHRTQCVYWEKKNDLHCAAGCLIAPDEYQSDFEGYSWSTLVRNYGISANHRNLISDLQCIHDTKRVEEWEEHFFTTAGNYNLTYKPKENEQISS